MSAGMLCLKCREYMARCKCVQPAPSTDAKRPHSGGDLAVMIRDAYAGAAADDIHLDKYVPWTGVRGGF